MKDDLSLQLSRRRVLSKAGQMLGAIAVVYIGAGAVPVMAKAKASKEDFYYQDEPDEDGKKCSGCINFAPKATGKYGADSGDCALLEGDVCSHCFCQGWTDKNSAGAKKAGT
jgi:hypothetical protein